MEWAFIPLHCCSKFLSEMCKAILTISSLRRSHNCRGFRYTKMLRQFVTAGVWSLSDAVIGYPCTAPLLCSCRGIIRLCRSMSVWSCFHAPMNFLTSPHSPQHSYSCNIFIGILYRSRASSIHIFGVQSTILCVKYTKILFLFVALTDIFTENA